MAGIIMLGMFRNLLSYRHFIISSIRNDVVNRFVRSKLGGLWIILNPLAQVLIYALILSNVLAAKLPGITSKYSYAIYLMAGLLAWNLFSEIINRCLNLFLEHANLMKKMQFPRITLPVIVAGTNIVNNIFLFMAMLIIFLLLGHQFSIQMLWLLPLMLLLTFFALGIGLILGVLNVFIRDIGQIIPIILQVFFWFTPIVYPITIIPEAYRHWLNFNPLYHFTHAYQEIILYGRAPELDSFLILGILSIILTILGLVLFRRASAEMVDVL